jgi:hypothetical protein
MRFLLTFFLIFAVYVQPIRADLSEEPFYAVWVNKGWEDIYQKYHPDLMETAHNFAEFDTFLDHVRVAAKNRPVILDLAIHGTREGLLALGTREQASFIATSGYIFNEIDEHLPTLQELDLESCYGSIVTEVGTHPALRHVDFDLGDKIDPWKRKPIPYPVYGVTNVSNYVPFVFVSRRLELEFEVVDLRMLIGHKIERPDGSFERCNYIRILNNALEAFYLRR